MVALSQEFLKRLRGVQAVGQETLLDLLDTIDEREDEIMRLRAEVEHGRRNAEQQRMAAGFFASEIKRLMQENEELKGAI